MDILSDETLNLARVRFKVLKQIQPGQIVIMDSSGRWLIHNHSTFYSVVRKLVAFFTQQPTESQRYAFLKTARDSVKTVIQHCTLLMKTALFDKTVDPATGVVNNQSVVKLNSKEIFEFENILQSIHSVAIDMYEGLLRLPEIEKHEAYMSDSNFISELEVNVKDPANTFFEQTFRRLGPYGPKVMSFLPNNNNNSNSNLQKSISSSNIAATVGKKM